MKKIIFVLVCVITLSACTSGSINAFYNRDVIEDDLSPSVFKDAKVGTISVTAQRRLIVANIDDGKFCSEPPPEAVSAVTDAIAAALQANLDSEKNVNASMAAQFSKQVNQIYTRSQAVQVFRDFGFYDCVDKLNSGITTRSIIGATASDRPEGSLAWAFEKTLATLNTEIPHLYALEKERAKMNAPSQELTCESTALVNGAVVDGTQQPNQAVSTSIICKPASSSDVAVENEVGNKGEPNASEKVTKNSKT